MFLSYFVLTHLSAIGYNSCLLYTSFEPAQSDPERWHHVGPFDMATGRKLCPGHPSEPAPRTYADITGEALSAAIERDPQVVGITAATPYIMGFTPELRAAAGKQFVDRCV